MNQKEFNKIKEGDTIVNKGSGGAYMGLKYEVIQMSDKDMQFIQLIQQKKVTREEILSIYGVPPILAGIMEFASYSNAIEQMR